MRFSVRTFIIGTLFLVPAFALAKAYVVPHVLESSGIADSGQTRTSSSSRGSNVTSAGQTTMPSAQEVQQMIEKKTGATIRWNPPKGVSSRHMKLTGTGTMGDNLSINISCTVSSPPLSIRCTITVSL